MKLIIKWLLSAASLLFDLSPAPASAPVNSFGQQPFGAPPGFPPGNAQPFGSPVPGSGSSFGSFPGPGVPSGSSFGGFPPQQQQHQQQQHHPGFGAAPVASSSSLSFDFNPRLPAAAAATTSSSAFGGNTSFVQQPQPQPVLQPQQFPSQQQFQQPQQQQGQDWASFSSFQGANTQPARPGDVVTTNQHLYNLEQLSAPANRGAAPEKKKTLAELAAESNAHRQPVLQSAPRVAPVAMLTPQQQYELQLYQRMQQQQQFGAPSGYPPQQQTFVQQPPPQQQQSFGQQRPAGW